MPSKGSKSSKSKNFKSSKSKSPIIGNPKEDEYVYVKPPPSPLPPDPPKAPLLSQILRQVWYPYANRAILEHKELFWSPFCPVITTWGHLFISEPPQRRILRYRFDPVSSKLSQIEPPLITKGEPRVIIEIPRTGRIAALLTCPTARKTVLVIYDPIELREENRIDFPYEVMKIDPFLSSSNSKKDNAIEAQVQEHKQEQNLYSLVAEKTPTGICCNSYALFVLFQPLQDILLFNPVTLKPIKRHIQNEYPDQNSCIHLTTCGGCAASDEYLCVAAGRPKRIQVFWLHTSYVLGQLGIVQMVLYTDIGLDRLSMGEPFGLQIDSMGLMVVSDSKCGFFHVFNITKRPPGPWHPSLPHGETCFLGSWKIDATQQVRPGYFSLAKNGTACVVDCWNNNLHVIVDKAQLRCLDDSYLQIGDNLFSRELIDPLMLKNGLPVPPLEPVKYTGLKHTTSDVTEPIVDEIILPNSWIEKYKRLSKAKEPEIPEDKSRSKSKSRGKSPNSRGASPKK